MAPLVSSQRNALYTQAAARTGIHAPLLAALYAVQRQPLLLDGDSGLGMTPAHQLPGDAVNTLVNQVHYAANTLRSLVSYLTAKGWQASDFWQAGQDRYSDRFIRAVADGYVPPETVSLAARLEPSDPQALLAAYLDALPPMEASTVPTAETSLIAADPELVSTALDQALLNFVRTVPRTYGSLGYQRQALMELLRLWRKLDTPQEVIQSLELDLPKDQTLDSFDPSLLDQPLLIFAQQVPQFYAGYPHQREAVIRLAQLWGRTPTRTAAIANLQSVSASQPDLALLDPVLIAFVQLVSSRYRGLGQQRLVLTDFFQAWNQLRSRETAIVELGIDPSHLNPAVATDEIVAHTAMQMDRSLLAFMQRLPQQYQTTEQQREQILQLVQHWHQFDDRDMTVQHLFSQLRQMETATRTALEAPPAPQPYTPTLRPERWTVENLQLMQSIVPNGSFTWADATQGGRYLPVNQAAVDSIVQCATQLQAACDRIGRPFCITRWYAPDEALSETQSTATDRFALGEAVEFYVPGLTADQVYWALTPWWPGGLGRYHIYPYLIYLDVSPHPVRWNAKAGHYATL